MNSKEMHLMDLIESPSFQVFVLNPDFEYSGDVDVEEGNIVIGSFLESKGLLLSSDVILRTNAGNLYRVSSNDYHGDRNGVVIEYIDPAKWTPVSHDTDTEVFSPDLLSELEHFKLVSLVLTFDNNPLFWWRNPIHESLLGNIFNNTNMQVIEIWNTPYEAFDEVKLIPIEICDYYDNGINVESNGNRFFHNAVIVKDDVNEMLTRLNTLLNTEFKVSVPNSILLEGSISLVRDISTGIWYSIVS